MFSATFIGLNVFIGQKQLGKGAEPYMNLQIFCPQNIKIEEKYKAVNRFERESVIKVQPPRAAIPS